jgi:hypothetical protein
MSAELKSAEEWLAMPQYDGLTIMDPDGWDRSPERWEASWNEKITADGFDRRWAISTCGFKRHFMERMLGEDKQ